MKREGRKKEGLGNKGFSLVELIIVIAIMAILTGLLAPQLIKYVERSRTASDDRNIELLESTTNIVLNDTDVTTAIAAGKITIANGSTPNFDTALGSDFVSAFKAATGDKYPRSKAKGTNGFQVVISGDATVGWKVTGSTTTP